MVISGARISVSLSRGRAMENLLEATNSILLPALLPMAWRVVERRESHSFSDALVVLQFNELRLRVVRDKGIIFVDFGSAASPADWFDSAVVVEYLGLSASGGFHDE